MDKIEVLEKDGKIFSHIRKMWLVKTPEEEVRQTFIVELVNKYGYPLEVMSEEYRTDYKGRGVRSTRADIVIYKSKEEKENNYNAFIVIECKAETVRIRLEDFYQGTEYVGKLRAQFLILHNSREINCYAVDMSRIPNKEAAFTQIIAIPAFADIFDDNKIEEIRKKTKTFSREDFTRTLKTCHNIIRNNDKLSPEAAFDEISKILFMKINFERDAKGSQVFTLEEYLRQKEIEKEYNKNHHIENPKPFMQVKFADTKKAYKDDNLFDENETIKIRENSFEQIIKILQVYNLSDTQDDVKGIAFEEFLGTTFRGELGQFFTPRTIVDFMVHILDPQEGEVICDPTCGSGGFLIKAFEYVREKIERDIKAAKDSLRHQLEGDDYESKSEEEQLKINKHIDEMQQKLNKELDTQQNGNEEKNIPQSRMYALSHDCIYGTDANPRMARTSKMNMIMHGDGHGGVHYHDGLLNVNGIFEERFDVILTNPPFGARVDKSLKISEADRFTNEVMIKKYEKRYGDDYKKALRQVNDNIGKSVLDLFDTGKMSGLTEVLFMERCLRLLKKGGRMGMVLPEGVLNTSNLAKVREYFEGRAKIILICSIPQDVFIAAGATVKPSLVFFKRFTEEEEKQYAECVSQAQNEKRAEKQSQIDELNVEKEKLSDSKTREDKARVKAIQKQIALIEEQIIEEAKPRVKELFDYEIPIALVNDAGITTTGAVSENNELPKLEKEFAAYNDKVKLWQHHDYSVLYEYNVGSDGSIVRTFNEKEDALTW